MVCPLGQRKQQQQPSPHLSELRVAWGGREMGWEGTFLRSQLLLGGRSLSM